MAKMRAMQVSRPGGPFEAVEREIPEPVPGAVRVKVEACGICHSDALTKEGRWPGIEFPRVPGHEVAGRIDALGAGVLGWDVGERVGIGWYGGHCGYCKRCRRGDFLMCQTERKISGITFDGGYQEYMTVSSQALARIPAEIPATDAAPLLCAGVTTYNALRHSGARPGDLVAVLGIGGLGHLGVQYAAKMGFRTVAIARGKEKEALARKLGAKHYIDSTASDVAEALTKLGGASLVLATAINGKAISAAVGGLGVDGKLVVVGAAPEPLEIPGLLLIGGRRSVQGWPSGTAMDSQDTMAFSALEDVKSMNEVYPLERAEEAYQRMMSGAARFRVVLKVAG